MILSPPACRFILFSSLLLCMALMLSGCVTSPPAARWQPVTRHEGNQVHVVVWPEESLPAIASWYTGSSDNAETLANANPTLNPLQLRKGDQVFIPHVLLKTRGSLSKAFLDTFNVAPVVTITTSSGANVVKTPRIIVPAPYKEKKGREGDDSVLLNDHGINQESQPPRVAPSTVTPDFQPVVEDRGIHLFGPK